ncbi:MAG: GNAT family N-acetyltransferase [Pseudomonadota bacterium]
MTTIEIPTLTTERLTLRAQSLADFEAYAATLASARMVHIDRLDRRDAWFVFCNDLAGWQLRGTGIWSVDRTGGPLVGWIGIQQPAHLPEPELGWLLCDGQEGQGYATEGARATLGWARSRMASLVSYIAPANSRSVAVAERLGATPDRNAPLPEGETPNTTRVFRHWGAAA